MIKQVLLGGLQLLMLLMTASACYEDKGNYDYNEVPVITAENMPQSITVIANVEPITLTPSFTSSTEGNIDGNASFRFGCRLYKRGGTFEDGERFIDIDEEGKKDIAYTPAVSEGDYVCWYTVTDTRTDVTTNFQIPVKVTSATYEGWMVLCDDEQEQVRLDFIAALSGNRMVPIYHVLGESLPALQHANSLFYDAWPRYQKGDDIRFTSGSGTYSINNNTLQGEANSNITELDFIIRPQDEEVVALSNIYQYCHFAITNKGNLYKKFTWMAGGAFEDPINTLEAGTKPQFTVAPHVGVIMRRPMGDGDNVALFYDKDNQRFLKWSDAIEDGNACVELSDPTGALFSFHTGKNLVDMVSTRFSDGVIYSILEDAAGRYVYGINLAGGSFAQTYYQKIDAPGFAQASQFAFHSQYPYMFYNDGDKICCYHLMNKTVSTPLTLGGEEITLLKFNLYQRSREDLGNQTDEFWNQQYNLVVGSYKKGTGPDRGILRFYKFNQTTGTLTLLSEYTGFGKIRDVLYRER